GAGDRWAARPDFVSEGLARRNQPEPADAEAPDADRLDPQAAHASREGRDREGPRGESLAACRVRHGASRDPRRVPPARGPARACGAGARSARWEDRVDGVPPALAQAFRPAVVVGQT